jgi:hypothetical protein
VGRGMFDDGKRDMGDVKITFLWGVYSEYPHYRKGTMNSSLSYQTEVLLPLF